MSIAAVVLAAGRSRRFGADNKLLADFRGNALASYVAETVQALPVDHHAVICSSLDVAALFEGFDVICKPDQTLEQSDSLRLAVDVAEQVKADKLLILLADMPLLTTDICQQVLDLSAQHDITAVTDGKRRMPPACFDKSRFDDLRELEGDRGAGPLLKHLTGNALVNVPATMLQDIDTPENLAALS